MTPGLVPYLGAVIQESLQCFAPVPSTLPRRINVVDGAVIDGYQIPRIYVIIVTFTESLLNLI